MWQMYFSKFGQFFRTLLYHKMRSQFFSETVLITFAAYIQNKKIGSAVFEKTIFCLFLLSVLITNIKNIFYPLSFGNFHISSKLTHDKNSN